MANLSLNREMEKKKPSFEIRPYGKTELASLYGVHWRTLKKRILLFLPQFNNRNKVIFPNEVKQIVEELGVPFS